MFIGSRPSAAMVDCLPDCGLHYDHLAILIGDGAQLGVQSAFDASDEETIGLYENPYSAKNG